VDLIFPHHENEIAQSEGAMGHPWVTHWVHGEFLMVEGEKMSKSLGNFFTLRDLVLRGHKPSSIRYLLSSVPYRNQLNFTFDGLQQAAVSVERLRNFQLRLTSGHFPAGVTESLKELAHETTERMRASLEDDLNTAQAQAAIFDLVRRVNVAIDAAQLRNDDVPLLLATIEKFDEIFAVVKDDDGAKMKSILEWARAEGREKEISPGLIEAVGAQQLSDEEIEKKIAEMEQARRARNFKASDAIRAEFAAGGILVENTKEGVRWKRK
jgi:cysteinyl-tRNA synthetase